MSIINLKVTLDTSKSPPALDVDESNGANQVSQNPSTQTIVWRLTGNAATGSFAALGGSSPGFAWIGTAPEPSIFGAPAPGNNGNQISVSDLNNGTSSAGTFYYQLRATINGATYTTVNSLLTGTTNNPAIINR